MMRQLEQEKSRGDGGEEPSSSVEFGFRLDPPNQEDQAEAFEAARRQAEQTAVVLTQRTETIRAFADLHGRWRDALIGRIGRDTWLQLMTFSRERRETEQRNLRQAPGPEGVPATERARKRAQNDSLTLLEKAGVSREELKKIHAVHAAELDSIASPPRDTGTLESVPESEVPEDVRLGKGNPWTIYTPPYAGWWWSYSWWRLGGYNPDLYAYIDWSTGAMGHRSDWSDYSASDLDAFSLDYDTQLGVWYRPPKAGRLDVWFRLRSASARSHIWLDDEWGWSDSHSRMWSHLTVNVSPVLADKDEMQIWWAWAKGSPDSKTYQNDWYTPGTVHWFHMTTSAPIPANSWTLLKVGTYDRRYTWLNDVSTWQMMRNRWYLEELYVDVI
jgi:hypothetical protein